MPYNLLLPQFLSIFYRHSGQIMGSLQKHSGLHDYTDKTVEDQWLNQETYPKFHNIIIPNFFFWLHFKDFLSFNFLSHDFVPPSCMSVTLANDNSLNTSPRANPSNWYTVTVHSDIFALHRNPLLKPFPNKLLYFMCLQYKSFENAVEKLLYAILIKFEIVICKLYHFGKGLNLTYTLLCWGLLQDKKDFCKGQRVNSPIPTQWHLLTPLGNKPFENTGGKGEIARNEQFLLFPQCFLSIWRTFCYLHKIKNSRLQTVSVWKSLEFVVW